MEKLIPVDTTTILSLNDGVKIPLFGLGTFMAPAGEAENVTLYALKNGYRLIDTAACYGLDLDYVDLYLMHSPSGGKVLETYNAMIKLKEEGLIRSVGVSNFGVHHLEGLRQAGKPAPSVNQFELHPYQRCEDIVKYCHQHHIGIMGYCPLVRCKKHSDPQLLEITKRYPGKTVSQVLLRWGIQNGYITIPKTTNPGRTDENKQIFDFEISEEDMNLMNNFPPCQAANWNPTKDPWTG